jgi:hypothetical protein
MKIDRLTQLKQLLADELKSDKPGLLYVEDLKLSIDRIESTIARVKFHVGDDYEMVNK